MIYPVGVYKYMARTVILLVGLIKYLLTFTEGVLTFISPCILPMLPVYLLYLAGESGKSIDRDKHAKNTLIFNSIGFIIGFTIVFVALGATVTALGHFLSDNRVILEKISGVVMILFGLNFTGILKLNFLNSEKRIEYKFDKLHFFSSLIFGMVFGFAWTPCLGAFLGSALLLASSTANISQGIVMLLLYSLGLGVPFLLTAVLFDRIKTVFGKIQKHGRIISIVSGLLLIAAGILVLTGSMKYLNYLVS